MDTEGTQATLKIEITSGYSECDDCGYYDYGRYEVTMPDGSTWSFNWGDHFGPPEDDFYPELLRKLGYRLEIT